MSLRRILLIASDDVTREALARLLEGDGYEVTVAEAAEGVARLRELDPQVVIYRGDLFEMSDGEQLGSSGARLIELKNGAERGPLPAPGGRRVVLPWPLNLEDLRLVMREG